MRRYLSIVILTCAACVAPSLVRAADVTFQLVGQLAVDAASDLSYSGTLARAYAFGTASPIQVNGMVFEPFASNSHGDSTNLDTLQTFPAHGGLTGGYATLVSQGLSRDGSPGECRFNGLIPGAEYAVTVVGMGLRARSDCCQAGAGYTNLIVSGDTPGGSGWIHWEGDDAASRNIRGNFIADSSGTQTLNLNLYGTGDFDPLTVSANINAVLLSYTSVPEPASVMLLGVATTSLAFVRRRRTIGD